MGVVNENSKKGVNLLYGFGTNLALSLIKCVIRDFMSLK